MITIEILHGSRDVGDDDSERAASAAEAVLARAGVNDVEAFEEFKRQWAELDSFDGMTGLAALWVEAEKASDLALTEGWANPAGASCTISAWDPKAR